MVVDGSMDFRLIGSRVETSPDAALASRNEDGAGGWTRDERARLPKDIVAIETNRLVPKNVYEVFFPIEEANLVIPSRG
jgi:hypothetical protein